MYVYIPKIRLWIERDCKENRKRWKIPGDPGGNIRHKEEVELKYWLCLSFTSLMVLFESPSCFVDPFQKYNSNYPLMYKSVKVS
jgi:hypothetical protein